MPAKISGFGYEKAGEGFMRREFLLVSRNLREKVNLNLAM